MLEYVSGPHVFRFEPRSEEFADWEYDKWCRVILEAVGRDVGDGVGFSRSVAVAWGRNGGAGEGLSGVFVRDRCGLGCGFESRGQSGEGDGQGVLGDERSEVLRVFTECGDNCGKRAAVSDGVEKQEAVGDAERAVGEQRGNQGSSDEQCRVVAVDSCESVTAVGKQAKKNARKRARAKELKKLCISSVEADVSGVDTPGDIGAVSRSVGSGEVLGDGCSSDGVNGKLRGDSSGSSRFERTDLLVVTTDAERKALARQWYERKSVENKLAIQRAKYNVKRNEYLDRSRISEQRWETERLSCDAKLARISAARLGCGGSAQTVVSEEEKSLRPPSLSTGSDSPAELSDGTISPDSSISVAEGVRLINKVKKVEGDYAEIKLKYDMLIKAVSMGGSKIVIDGKDIHEYDGTGQYVPPFNDEVESLYDGRGHLLDAWEAGMDY